MSYLVVARKWRPQRFEDVIGQEHVVRVLTNAIRLDRIAHAYLFAGVRGVGKTTAARIFAKALNCAQGPTPEPCNVCSSCVEITDGNALDVYEIDGASHRGIDEVRQVIENVRYRPAQARFKIYIIDEVHQVTREAFNALLKTLEEPPPYVKFLLATTEPHRLPETILSRCQRLDFRRIPLRTMVERLRGVTEKEGFAIAEEALFLLAREAEGSMRDAESRLEQVLAGAVPSGEAGGAIDERTLRELFGIAEREVIYEFSRAVIQGDARRCVELIAEVTVRGMELQRLSRDLVEHFRNLLVARLMCEQAGSGEAGARRLLDLPDQEWEDLKGQAADLSVDTLVDYFKFMAEGDEEVERSAYPRFALETALIRLAMLPRTLAIGELLERLEAMERRLSQDRPREAPPPMPRKAPTTVEVAGTGQKGAPQEDPWKRFVGFVMQEKKFLAVHLEQARPLKMPPGKLEIGVEDRHRLSYLQDPENLSLIRNFARRFFAEDVPVAVLSLAGGKPQKEPERTGRPEEGTHQEKEVVQEALRIFGGSIKAVKKGEPAS